MFESLKQNPGVANALRQYEALPSREQLALKVLAIAVALSILYFAAWQPAKDYMDAGLSARSSNQQLLELVQQNKNVLLAQRRNSNSSKPQLDSQQLVSSITNLAKRHSVPLKRFEPSGENKVKVWLEDASFDKTMAWLSSMNKSLGVQVEQVSLDAEDEEGLISARFTLGT